MNIIAIVLRHWRTVLLVGAAGLYAWGIHHYGATRYAAGAASVQSLWDKAKAQAAIEQQRNAARAHAASAQYQKEKTHALQQQQARQQAIAHVVQRPVYRSECLDADGLRHINAAIAGAAPSSR